MAYVHLGDSFPKTEKDFVVHPNLNLSPKIKFSFNSPYQALYLCNNKHRSRDGKYPSPWIKLVIEEEYDRSENRYTVTLTPNAKIYDIRSLDDLRNLQEKYGFMRLEYPCEINKYKKHLEYSEKIRLSEEEITRLMNNYQNEFNNIKQKAEETQEDVYFNCSKKKVVKLYDRLEGKIVFELQYRTNGKNTKVLLKTPLIYQLEEQIKKENKKLETYKRVYHQHFQIQEKPNLNYNQMRLDGYHGLEIHPEFSQMITQNDDYEDEFWAFFRWLSFPQLIVWKWCFQTIKEEPMNWKPLETTQTKNQKQTKNEAS